MNVCLGKNEKKRWGKKQTVGVTEVVLALLLVYDLVLDGVDLLLHAAELSRNRLCVQKVQGGKMEKKW